MTGNLEMMTVMIHFNSLAILPNEEELKLAKLLERKKKEIKTSYLKLFSQHGFDAVDVL